MNVSDALKRRKSIRSFTGEAISETELQTILEAAQSSAVGMGAYNSLTLTVIQDNALIEKIDKNAQEKFGRDGAMLYGAPTLIVVATKLAGNPMDNVAYSNAATIVENMVLEAVELDVGACHIWGTIVGLNQNPELVRKLGLQEGFTPVCAVALGKTDERYEERDIPANRIDVKYL